MELEFAEKGFRVWYEPESYTVFFEGTLRLNTRQYKPLSEMLQTILRTNPQTITLHLRELSFLNSSGINTLYKFAIALRKQSSVGLIILSSRTIAWQAKSLPNIKRFLPSASLEVL